MQLPPRASPPCELRAWVLHCGGGGNGLVAMSGGELLLEKRVWLELVGGAGGGVG